MLSFDRFEDVALMDELLVPWRLIRAVLAVFVRRAGFGSSCISSPEEPPRKQLMNIVTNFEDLG